MMKKMMKKMIRMNKITLKNLCISSDDNNLTWSDSGHAVTTGTIDILVNGNWDTVDINITFRKSQAQIMYEDILSNVEDYKINTYGNIINNLLFTYLCDFIGWSQDKVQRFEEYLQHNDYEDEFINWEEELDPSLWGGYDDVNWDKGYISCVDSNYCILIGLDVVFDYQIGRYVIDDDVEIDYRV